MSTASAARQRWRAALAAALVLPATVATLLFFSLREGANERVVTRAGAADAPAAYQGGDRLFKTRDSVTIMARQLVLRSRGAVIIVHGLGEPDSLFARWNEVLSNSTQMSVIGFALRGNGRSRFADDPGNRTGDYLLDVAAIITELKRRNPSGPLLALATHGGLGLLAQYEAQRGARDLPAFDGIIVLDGEHGEWARVPDNRPVVLYARRLRTLERLTALGVPLFDHLEVAAQPRSGAELATRWTFGQWRAASPDATPLLAAQARTRTPMLFVSRRAAPDSLPPGLNWSTVTGALDPNTPAVRQAITRWSGDYAEAAYEPVPPRPTQTLDILRKP